MKIAVLNFSGNVGKTTVVQHLLKPRLPGCRVVAIESINAADGQAESLRSWQLDELQEFLQLADDVVVDVGASNIEELLESMRSFRGSQDDFDYFIVPTVPALKQQQDTIATLVELEQIGVAANRVRLLFNMVERRQPVEHAFDALLEFLAAHPVAVANPACRMGINEIYRRVKLSGQDLATLLEDRTDYKMMIADATDQLEKIGLARRLATQRLASGVVPELDACFSALSLAPPPVPPRRGAQRKPA